MVSLGRGCEPQARGWAGGTGTPQRACSASSVWDGQVVGGAPSAGRQGSSLTQRLPAVLPGAGGTRNPALGPRTGWGHTHTVPSRPPFPDSNVPGGGDGSEGQDP